MYQSTRLVAVHAADKLVHEGERLRLDLAVRLTLQAITAL